METLPKDTALHPTRPQYFETLLLKLQTTRKVTFAGTINNYPSCEEAEESFVNSLQYRTPLIPMQYLTDAVQILHKRPVFNITFPSMPRPSLQFFQVQFCIYLSHKYAMFPLTQHFYYFFNATRFDRNHHHQEFSTKLQKQGKR